MCGYTCVDITCVMRTRERKTTYVRCATSYVFILPGTIVFFPHVSGGGPQFVLSGQQLAANGGSGLHRRGGLVLGICDILTFRKTRAHRT